MAVTDGARPLVGNGVIIGACPKLREPTRGRYDEKTTYPVRAGTVAIDAANTVHWDGARLGEKQPAVLVLVGMGPVETVQVDENGKPKAPPVR